ncbi:MAG: type I-C CRISPR-associated protein Cas5c [Helicobacteraceae bacterium]|jgi:CRISPR-associated protein Cas5d|nr:type I-C CRISPR-associated protein Cas5c [Helicobacteraceae bacterium]
MTIERKRNSIEFSISAKYALFSDPITRVGGEKNSYMAPTYQALKGIVESVYWKPTLIWYIDAARVMNKIQTESKGIRPISYSGGKNELAYYAYLKDVCYQVLAHFEWNELRDDLKADRNENKHHNVAKRMVERGGRRDIFLGTRECQGYVEPLEFGSDEGFYDNYGEIDLGVMFHGFDYPNEADCDAWAARFDRVKINNGYIVFNDPRAISNDMRRNIRRIKTKSFGESNLLTIDAEFDAIFNDARNV